MPPEIRIRIYDCLIFQVSDYTSPRGQWLTQNPSPFTFYQMLSMYLCEPMLQVNQQVRHEYAFQVCVTKQAETPVDANLVGFNSHREIEIRFDETHHHDFVLHAGNGTRELKFFFEIVCPLYYPRPPIFLKYTRSAVINIVSKCAPRETLFENGRFDSAEYELLAAAEIRHLQFASYLPFFLKGSFERLQFVRINLHLWGQRFTFSWLLGELDKLRVGICNLDPFMGTELLVSVEAELSRSNDNDFQLLAKSGPGGLGWRHVGETAGVNKDHDTGVNEDHSNQFRNQFCPNCLQCWIDRRAAGAKRLRLARKLWIWGLPFPQWGFRKERIRWG